jgi:hypothetical protein
MFSRLFLLLFALCMWLIPMSPALASSAMEPTMDQIATSMGYDPKKIVTIFDDNGWTANTGNWLVTNGGGTLSVDATKWLYGQGSMKLTTVSTGSAACEVHKYIPRIANVRKVIFGMVFSYDSQLFSNITLYNGYWKQDPKLPKGSRLWYFSKLLLSPSTDTWYVDNNGTNQTFNNVAVTTQEMQGSGTNNKWRMMLIGHDNITEKYTDVVVNEKNLSHLANTYPIRIKDVGASEAFPGSYDFAIETTNKEWLQTFSPAVVYFGVDILDIGNHNSPNATAMRFSNSGGVLPQPLDTNVTFTANATTDEVTTSAANGFEVGQIVRTSNSGGGLPAGLVVNTDYCYGAATSTTVGKLYNNLLNCQVTASGTASSTASAIIGATTVPVTMGGAWQPYPGMTIKFSGSPTATYTIQAGSTPTSLIVSPALSIAVASGETLSVPNIDITTAGTGTQTLRPLYYTNNNKVTNRENQLKLFTTRNNALNGDYAVTSTDDVIGDTAIPTNGWGVAFTQGTKLRFANHATVYTVVGTASATTTTIYPALTANVPVGTAITAGLVDLIDAGTGTHTADQTDNQAGTNYWFARVFAFGVL